MMCVVERRSCHSGVMTGAGWVIPVDKLIETGQIHFSDCNAYLAVGMLSSRRPKYFATHHSNAKVVYSENISVFKKD